MKKIICFLYILFCSSIVIAQLPTNGLVAWYPFCGNTVDYSGNAYNMTNGGATLTTDRFGNINAAYEFNGVNNIINTSTLLPTSTDQTYACWINPYTLLNAAIIYNGNTNINGIGLLVSNGISPGTGPGQKISILLGGINLFLPTTVSLNTWHHLVLRKTGTSFELIIDNVSSGTFTGSFNPPSGVFAVGLDYTNTTNPFGGKIDDIAIYSRALTNAEITQLYNYNPAVIPFVAGSDTTVCEGSMVTLAAGVPAGAWNSGNPPVATVTNTGVVSGIAGGISLITFSTGVGCEGIATVTVIPPPAVITGNTPFCTGSTITLSDATTGGTWSSGSPAIATIGTFNGVVTGVSTGTSVITYSTSSGCMVTASVIVNQEPSPISGPSSVCTGSSIQLSNTIPGGTWSSSNPSVVTVVPFGASQGTVTGIAVGNAMITYTLAGGCFKTLLISVSPVPDAISGNMNICAGSTTSLSNTVAGGTWSSASPGIASVSPSGIVTGVLSGTAIISYTTGGGCFDTAIVTVYAAPAPISGQTTICLGAATQLSNSTPGGTWSSSNTTIATIIPSGTGQGTVSGISTGTTVISYTLPGGCSSSLTVTVNTSPSAISGNTQLCGGTTVTLSNSVAGGIWTSSSPSRATITPGTGIVSGISAGTTVISYAIGSCVVTTTVIVNITPSIVASSTNICTDGTAQLSSAPGGGTWSSSNISVATITSTGSNTALVTGITSGGTVISYTLAGCIKTTTLATVAILPVISGPSLVCTGSSIALSNIISGGTWTSSSTTVSVNPLPGIVTGIAPGNATITYSIGGSCTTIATLTVVLTPDPGIISGPANVCVGSVIFLSDTVAGGTWSASSSALTVVNGTVTAIAAGTITISYIVSNASCMDTALKIITSYQIPDAGIITGPSSVCVGQNISLSNNMSGGIWYATTPSVATINTVGVVTGISAGADIISYTVSNPGCTSVTTYTVTVYGLPAAGTITGIPVVCKGTDFAMSNTVTNGIWSSSSTSVATINGSGQVYATNTGVTTITYTTGPNTGGCYGHSVYTFTVVAPFTIDSIVSQIKCYNDANGSISITINDATTPIQYSWSNGNTTSSISGLSPGFYTLTVAEIATQCIVSDTFRITEPDSMYVTVQTTMDKCNAGMGNITTAVTGGTMPYSYLWSNNNTAAELQNLHSGIYSVTVSDAHGCVKMLPVEITDTCADFVIHNVITPNGDGVNDKWIIEGIDAFPGNTVSVFDKWGDVVYEKTNYANDWYGMGKSGLLPDGTYYYLIKLPATSAKGENVLPGSIMIKR